MEACNVDLGLRLLREAGQSIVCLAVLSSSPTRLTMVRWVDHAFTRATTIYGQGLGGSLSWGRRSE